MIKKILKSTKSKNSKFTLRFNKTEIISFCKKNTAVAILIALAALFIAIGNSFVVGALIGGYIAAKQSEKLNSSSNSSLLILTTSIGAVLGGFILMISVLVGAFFHTIGGIVGLFVGGTAIAAFFGDLTTKIAFKLQNIFFTKKCKKTTRASSKLHKKTSISKRKVHLKAT
ncbi:MAG: hypothetical protein HRU36_00555 [Rickettsiales bacterium]|nr:hypothetical protein [Rickettsiales bacterium]